MIFLWIPASVLQAMAPKIKNEDPDMDTCAFTAFCKRWPGTSEDEFKTYVEHTSVILDKPSILAHLAPSVSQQVDACSPIRWPVAWRIQPHPFARTLAHMAPSISQ